MPYYFRRWLWRHWYGFSFSPCRRHWCHAAWCRRCRLFIYFIIYATLPPLRCYAVAFRTPYFHAAATTQFSLFHCFRRHISFIELLLLMPYAAQISLLPPPLRRRRRPPLAAAAAAEMSHLFRCRHADFAITCRCRCRRFFIFSIIGFSPLPFSRLITAITPYYADAWY